MSAKVLAFRRAGDRAGRASPEPHSAVRLGHSATIANAFDNPILRAIDTLQSTQDARVRSKLDDAEGGVWR